MIAQQSYQIPALLGYAVAIVVALVLLDRFLLRAEARGWINYRRNGLSRAGPLYHTLELQSIFDPGIHQTMEIRYEEKKNQDPAGDPLKNRSSE